MDFIDVAHKRRMVRHFTQEPVAAESIERILDAARLGPSAGFTQGQDFVVVTQPENKQEIARLCGEEHYQEAGFHAFISGAPLLVIPCTNEKAYHQRYQESDKVDDAGNEINWPVPYWFMDIGCAVMLLLLAVTNEGLAAGFVGSQHFAEIRELLGIPDGITPVGVIPIGYPAPDKRSPSLKRGRRSTREVIHYEAW